MAKSKSVNLEREKQIGARLRAFREALQIPRSSFAVAIGYGSERIASYESGRAPLPYEVFKAVYRRYQISPLYLALNRGSPKYYREFDDTLAQNLNPRALFSEVFDKYLELDLVAAEKTATQLTDTLRATLKTGSEFVNDESIPIEDRLKFADAVAPMLHKLADVMKPDLKMRKAVREKLNLPDTETVPRVAAEVKAQLPSLLERLKKATAETGKKSELAEFLARATKANVPLASVSRWLSGEREPGGEVALQLLKWVELQERSK